MMSRNDTFQQSYDRPAEFSNSLKLAVPVSVALWVLILALIF